MPNTKTLIFTLVALFAVVIMLLLGFWQLDRAAQKRERLALIAQRANLAVLSVDDLDSSFSDIRDLPLRISGTFNREHYYLLDNRVHEGQVGFEIIGQLQTHYGVVLVNLGWVKGSEDRTQLPSIGLPESEIVIKGIVAVPELNPWVEETASDNAPWPRLIQQLDLALLQSWQPQHRWLDFVLLVDPQHPVGFVREWKPVVMSPEKHLGYALQWFGLSVAALIVFIVVWRKQKKGNQNG